MVVVNRFFVKDTLKLKYILRGKKVQMAIEYFNKDGVLLKTRSINLSKMRFKIFKVIVSLKSGLSVMYVKSMSHKNISSITLPSVKKKVAYVVIYIDNVEFVNLK